MMRLIWINFFRSGVVKMGLPLLLMASLLGILVGKQFSDQQRRGIQEAAHLQQEQLHRHVESFKDEIGYMLYYAKFSLVNTPSPIGGLSIGQRDVNPTTMALTIRNIEAQKYDADLSNPYNQMIGNIDFSFVLIFLFPLIIVGFTYNLISEEQEAGTWNLVRIQSKNIRTVLLRLLSVRVLLVCLSFLLLSFVASLMLHTGLGIDFWKYLVAGVLYILMWFSFCFSVISFRMSSSSNALILLSFYLLLLIVLPGMVNSYLENKYPVPEALEVTVKQRKAYHEKWDMDHGETMDKFFAHYPQFKQYPIPDADFSWPVYYAMQQMGDDESAVYSKAFQNKLEQRNNASERISRFIPSLHLQLQLNSLAKSDLENHLRFLNAANAFHEKIRLHFYPKIFENKPSMDEDWNQWKEEYYEDDTSVTWFGLLMPLTFFMVLFAGVSAWKLRQFQS
jgi:ABC-2 type transport system permease protein